MERSRNIIEFVEERWLGTTSLIIQRISCPPVFLTKNPARPCIFALSFSNALFMFIRLALLVGFFLSVFSLSAQEVEKSATKASGIEKPSRDFLMFQLTYENWNNTPDSIRVTGLGRGVNAYLCYDWPIGKSNFSFAAGVGIGTANIYLDNQEIRFSDTGALGAQVRFIPEQEEYKRYKLTTAYLEAPFELRFFGNKQNRNRGFKAAIGFRAGMIVGAHTKGRRTVEGTKMSEKTNTRRYMETWRFAGTVRLGWGNVSLFGAYGLNNLFKSGMGPDVSPFSVGICLTGL